MFIVLEGIDGCGKSTQAKLIHEWLIQEGHDALLTCEPTRSGVGSFLRDILSGDGCCEPETLALLFTADRYEHMNKVILPALDSGKIVVCERFYYSTVAYQVAQGLSRDWICELNRAVIENSPDLAFMIDITPERAVEKLREKEKRIREEAANTRKEQNLNFERPKAFESDPDCYGDFLERVRKEYLLFEDLILVDGSADVNEVFAELTVKIKPYL